MHRNALLPETWGDFCEGSLTWVTDSSAPQRPGCCCSPLGVGGCCSQTKRGSLPSWGCAGQWESLTAAQQSPQGRRWATCPSSQQVTGDEYHGLRASRCLRGASACPSFCGTDGKITLLFSLTSSFSSQTISSTENQWLHTLNAAVIASLSRSLPTTSSRIFTTAQEAGAAIMHILHHGDRFQSGDWLKVTDEVLDPESSLCLCDAEA